jgi:hypothetical protein
MRKEHTMSSQKSTARIFTPALSSTMQLVASVSELHVIELPVTAPTRRRAILRSRVLSGCRRHFVRRERCSHRRRPSAVRVALS